MALGVYRKITLAPGIDLVHVQRLLDLPGVIHGQKLGWRIHVARTITNWRCM
jgi:hypothetical protein